MHRFWPFALALVLAGGWAYSTSFQGVFVGDDIDAIVTNPHVRELWSPGQALSAPSDTTAAGRPIVSLTLALNYALAQDGLQPWGYHAFNLLVHLAAGLALFAVTRRTLLSSPLQTRFGQASSWIAFSIALLWVLHPLQTSAVTYVIQRAEALMGLFLLLTLYASIRATAEPSSRGRWWGMAAIAACALGVGSKEVMIVAPLLVAAWIWVFRPEGSLRDHRTRALLAGLASTWLLLVWLVMSNARGESVGFDLGGWTWWSYLRTQSAVIVHYLKLAVVPSPLVFAYAWPPASSWIAVAPQFALLVLLAATTVLAIARRHPLGYVGAWFFLVLAPSSSVLPIATEVAAEHRMYLPLAAVIACTISFAYLWLPRLLVLVLVAAVAATFAVSTHARNRDYWSVEALMRDTVQKRPGNAKARVVLGGHLLGREQYADAEAHLRAALSVPRHPGDDPGLPALAHMYLGSALAAQGRLDEGIENLERARAMEPDLGEPHAFLGEAYASQGRLVEAAESFDRAVAALPDVPPLLDRAARLRATAHDARARDGIKAVRYAERAVTISGGTDWRMLDTLAAAYAEAGRFEEATATIQRALDTARRAPEPRAVSVLASRLPLYQAERPLREP